jgi:hypothetical protein
MHILECTKRTHGSSSGISLGLSVRVSARMSVLAGTIHIPKYALHHIALLLGINVSPVREHGGIEVREVEHSCNLVERSTVIM